MICSNASLDMTKALCFISLSGLKALLMALFLHACLTLRDTALSKMSLVRFISNQYLRKPNPTIKQVRQSGLHHCLGRLTLVDEER